MKLGKRVAEVLSKKTGCWGEDLRSKAQSGKENEPFALENQTTAGVLLFAYDTGRLLERVKALSQLGYGIHVISRLSSAVTFVQRKGTHFNILVVGHAVPERERLRVARLYKHARPDGKVIFLYETRIKNADCASALLSVNGAKNNLVTTIVELAGC